MCASGHARLKEGRVELWKKFFYQPLQRKNVSLMFCTYTLKIYLHRAANYVLSLNGCVSCMQIDVCVFSGNSVISKVVPYILFLSSISKVCQCGCIHSPSSPTCCCAAAALTSLKQGNRMKTPRARTEAVFTWWFSL